MGDRQLVSNYSEGFLISPSPCLIVMICMHYHLPSTVNFDFFAMNEDVFFLAGARPGFNDRECFTFLPNDDIIVESTEGIDLVGTPLSTNIQFVSGGDSATIHILDDG